MTGVGEKMEANEKPPENKKIDPQGLEVLIKCMRESDTQREINNHDYNATSLFEKIVTFLILTIIPFLVIIAAFSATKYGPSAGGLFNKNIIDEGQKVKTTSDDDK